MAKGLFFEESFSLLLMPNVLLRSGLFHDLGLLDIFVVSLENDVHFETQANVFGYWVSGHSSVIFPNTFLFAVLWSLGSFGWSDVSYRCAYLVMSWYTSSV